jgi:hypothetical protein
MNMNDGLNKLRGVVIDNLPHILTGFGVVGLAVTAYESYEAGKKVERMEERDAKDIAKTILPAVVTGVLSAAATVGSDVVHTKRYASLLTSYLVLKAEGPKLKKTAEDIIGKDKVKEIEKRFRAENSNESDEKRAAELSKVSPTRNFRVVDAITGFEFYSTIEKLYKAEQRITKVVACDGHATLEEFYMDADNSNEPFNAPGIAEHIFWDLNDGYDCMDLVISKEVDDDMNPFLVIGYECNTDGKAVRSIP